MCDDVEQAHFSTPLSIPLLSKLRMLISLCYLTGVNQDMGVGDLNNATPQNIKQKSKLNKTKKQPITARRQD